MMDILVILYVIYSGIAVAWKTMDRLVMSTPTSERVCWIVICLAFGWAIMPIILFYKMIR